METQKIVNLLNGSVNENSKFATKKWYIIDNESKGNYSHHNPIKFLKKSIESSLCNYFDAYILVTGNINVAGGNDNTKVAFKNFAPLKDCRTEINDTFVDYADFINITMPMYNLIEYSDNSDTSGSLWNCKRDETIGNINLANDNCSSFKYKSNLIGNTDEDGANRKKENVRIACPLKYLSHFWRSLEMLLINCTVDISLKWIENFILSTAGTAATFKITDAKIYVPILTLKDEDNTKLSKLLSDGFKRSIHWNEYKVIPEKIYTTNENIIILIDPSWQEINRLFVLVYLNDATSTANSYREYFLPRIKIENYNIKIDGRNFYDQPINGSIKQYDEIRKISTGQGDDYTTGCLLDFSYLEKNYRLISADLSKQKSIRCRFKSNSTNYFTGKISQTAIIYYIYQKSEETILEFFKRATKVL